VLVLVAASSHSHSHSHSRWPIVWEGRYSYFRADDARLVFSNGTTDYEYVVRNDTSRLIPSCADCLQDEVVLPLNTTTTTTTGPYEYIYYMELGFYDYKFTRGTGTGTGTDVLLGLSQPDPEDGFTLADIRFSRRSQSSSQRQHQGYFPSYRRGTLVVPEGYDGYACDEIQFDLVLVNEEKENTTDKLQLQLQFLASNVVLGAFQEQGYCPSKLFYPCAENEKCLLENDELRCIFNPQQTWPFYLQEDFQPLTCTTTFFPGDADPPLLPVSNEILGPWPGLRIHNSNGRTILQASSYEFTINNGTTQVDIPKVFDEEKMNEHEHEHEIFLVWLEDNAGLERRMNLQFKRTRFAPILSSWDGWTLQVLRVYDDSLPDYWTEWNLPAPDQEDRRPHTTTIEVPPGASLFHCEYVEFNLVESTHQGGQNNNNNGLLIFHDLVLGAMLQPEHNICDMPVYNPCASTNQRCHAINGNVTCLDPPGSIGEDVLGCIPAPLLVEGKGKSGGSALLHGLLFSHIISSLGGAVAILFAIIV
jgi:hypothetical protein